MAVRVPVGLQAKETLAISNDEHMGIAERNEEINRRRLERAKAGNGGQAKVFGTLADAEGSGTGGPQITNMAAYKQFLAKADEAAKKAKELETAEELERMRREGANYKPRAQREAEAKARRERYKTGGEDEARGVSSWCNPLKDYYKILGLDKTAALAEIKKAYKRLALQYHPDKQKNATAEQLDEVKDKFKDVMEAYDVLSDEERRGSWERLRENMKSGGASEAAVRQMTPEEALAYMRGLRELAQIKRQGYKRTKKAPPIEQEVKLSMRKMYSGHNKTVEVVRKECDSTGGLIDKVKVFHLMIRRGAYDGMKLVFEDDGNETTEYLPGDVIFILRQKPQKEFKRSGPKDIVHIGPPVERGVVYYYHTVQSLMGTNIVMMGNALELSFQSGGMGGFIEQTFILEGMQDPDDPWEKDPGDLIVKLYNTGVRFEERIVRTRVAPHSVYLVGSGDAAGPAAIAGAAAAAHLQHAAEAKELEAEERDASLRAQQGATGADAAAAASTASAAASCCSSGPLLVALCLSEDGCVSPAAEAALESARVRLVGARCKLLRAKQTYADPASLPAKGSMADALLWDEDYAALCDASLVVVDLDCGAGGSAEGAAAAEEAVAAAEARIVATGAAMARCGLRNLLCDLWLQGTQVVAVGDGVGLLGSQSPEAAGGDGASWEATALVPRVLRAGGGANGWRGLHKAVAQWAGPSSTKGVGVTAGSLLRVDPCVWWDPDGSVETLVVPSKDMLIATAAAVASGVSGAFRWDDAFDETDDEMLAADEGFMERCTKQMVLDSIA